MSSHNLLEAHTAARKARLAQLHSLKRKQASSSTEDLAAPASAAETHLSGRNYSAATRGPKLGFEHAPTEHETTLEDQAREIARATAAQQRADELEDRPIDLFKLQPKKPNWDLKRDLERRLLAVNARTDNAIRRLVVQRVKSAQAEKGGEAEAGGLEGASFVEGVHVREREEMEEREREEEEEEL